MLLVIVIIVLAIGYWYIATRNQILVTLERVNNAKAQIAAQTESRWDGVSSLIAATSKYSKEEADLLKDITQSRSKIGNEALTSDIERDDALFEEAIRGLNVVVENYPEIKSSKLYEKTMSSINEHEDNVRHSRMIFNDTVTKYNNAIIVFPTSIIAQIHNLSTLDYFEVSENKKDVPSWE